MMRPRRNIVIVVLLLLAGSAAGQGAAAAARSASAASAPIAVIVNARNKVDNVSSEFLRSAFLKRRKRWPDGKPMMVFNARPKSALRVAFDKQVLKLTAEAAAQYWIQRRIRGEGAPPLSAPPRSLVRIVEHQRTALCYVPLAAARGSTKVRVLRVDGKAPGDEGYPLLLRKP